MYLAKNMERENIIIIMAISTKGNGKKVFSMAVVPFEKVLMKLKVSGRKEVKFSDYDIYFLSKYIIKFINDNNENIFCFPPNMSRSS